MFIYIKTNKDLLVPQYTMQLNYCFFFFKRKSASLDIRSQIVSPAETAALSTSLQTYKFKANKASRKHESPQKKQEMKSRVLTIINNFYKTRSKEEEEGITYRHSLEVFSNSRSRVFECNLSTSDLPLVSMALS